MIFCYTYSQHYTNLYTVHSERKAGHSSIFVTSFPACLSLAYLNPRGPYTMPSVPGSRCNMHLVIIQTQISYYKMTDSRRFTHSVGIYLRQNSDVNDTALIHHENWIWLWWSGRRARIQVSLGKMQPLSHGSQIQLNKTTPVGSCKLAYLVYCRAKKSHCGMFQFQNLFLIKN